MKDPIKKQLTSLPNNPGVYIFKTGKGKVLYVGKALFLKKRVNSYFRNVPLSGKIAQLICEIKKIDYIPTSNEAEALLLENSLIKHYNPKYNVMYRDDKSYPFLEVTNRKFPRINITRKKNNKSSLYLGPFTNVKLLKEALIYLRRIIPFRTCKNLPKKACLDYDINLCPAPCEEKITKTEYLKLIRNIKMYLQGKKAKLIKVLEQEMHHLSKKRKYEEALVVRDRIKALTRITSEVGLSPDIDILYRIKKSLKLSNLPDYIEAFDISNISGNQAVGSMVAFKKAYPYKNGYRRFKIKNILSLDDYKMIEEVLTRRYLRVLANRKKLPDLIVIDGGKGHLNVAVRSLKELGIDSIDIIAIAKRFDFIYYKSKNTIREYKLDPDELKIIQHIRDESHRFAKTYHHVLRNKLIKASELDNIPGIGPKRKKVLLKTFGSIENIKNASVTKLANLGKIPPTVACKIKDYFK